jgi:hypothetical protein
MPPFGGGILFLRRPGNIILRFQQSPKLSPEPATPSNLVTPHLVQNPIISSAKAAMPGLPMKISAFAASAGILVTVAVFDYATGYELLCHVFYFVPIAIAAWFGGRRPAWGAAVLATAVWALVDYFDGHKYSLSFYRYWNIGMFFGSFAIVGELIARLRAALAAAVQLAAEKDAALRELEESTLKLRRLEGSFQTMCAWTIQIKDGDEWVSFQEFLYRRLQIRLTHSISPKGVSLLKSRAEDKSTPPP